MFIPIHYKYKSYPDAPRTTWKSKGLGLMTSLFFMCLWSFLVLELVSDILVGCGAGEGMAYGVGAIFVIPFVYGVLKWKKYMEQKLDEAAEAEVLKMMSMTEEEKTLEEKQFRKKRLYYVGGLILVLILLRLW